MKFIYDGPSLPMVEVGNQIIRVQRLVRGRWETFETEEMYEVLFPELKDVQTDVALAHSTFLSTPVIK